MCAPAGVLRRVQAPISVTAVDYSSTRCRFSTGLDANNLAAFLQEQVGVVVGNYTCRGLD